MVVARRLACHGLPGQVQPEGEPLDGDEVNRVVFVDFKSFFVFHYNDHLQI